MEFFFFLKNTSQWHVQIEPEILFNLTAWIPINDVSLNIKFRVSTLYDVGVFENILFRVSTRIRSLGGFIKIQSGERFQKNEQIHWISVDGRPIRMKIYVYIPKIIRICENGALVFEWKAFYQKLAVYRKFS